MKKFFTLIAMMFAASATMFAQDVEWGPNEFENSDLEAEGEYPWFHVKSNFENPDGAITHAVSEAGIGTEGSKGIKVVAKGGASAPWDSQFWIEIPTEIANGVLEYGESVQITFDCRAEWESIDGDETVEAVSIGTQGHNEPGSYRNNTGVGTVEFKKEWSKHVATMAPDANPYSIAFNLCEGQFPEDITFYFDNITIQRVKKSDEIIQYWAKLNTNGDFETDNTDSYVVRIYQQGDSAPEIVEGVGVDDSRAIKIVIPAKVDTDWDSQFFIKLKEVLPEGQAFKVSMDIKASEKPANQPQTQAHGTNPGDYVHWACIGDMTFDTEWTTFEKTVTVSSDMASKDNFQVIAFNMSRNDHEITYYFDNINIRILKEGSAGDIPEIIELQETLDNAYDNYANASTPANSEIREAFKAAYDEAQTIVDALDQENAEKAMYALISAQSKFVASINDYKSLQNHINWIQGKSEIAGTMGDNYVELKSNLEEVIGSLWDSYSAEAWTKAEISANTQQATVKKMIADYLAENVKDGDDITIMLENPSFAGNTSGWQRDGGSKFLDYGPSNRNTLDMEDGKDGYLPTGMAEVWHGSYNAYQVMSNLPAGLYTLTVNACQRADEDTNESAVLYGSANGQETTQLIMSVYADPAPEMLFDSDADPKWPSIENPNGEGWIPNGKGSANYHLNAGYYLNTVNFLLENGGDLRIGVKDANTTAWIVLDNFKVIYHSLDNVEAYKAAVENQIARLEALISDENVTISTPAKNEAEEILAQAYALIKGDYTTETCKAMNNNLNETYDAVTENINTLKAAETYYWDVFSDAYIDYAENAMPEVAKRADEADAKSSDMEEMTTEEIKAWLAEITYLVDALKIPGEAANASDENPVAMKLFVDPDFEDYAEIGANKDYPGWSGSGFGTGGGTAGPVGERWNQTNGFDTYTTFKGLPEGTYELSCDGGYRIGGAGSINDYNLAQADTINANVPYLYATTSVGTEKTYLPNVYSVLVTEEIAAEKELDFTSGDNATITVQIDSVTSVKYLSPQQLATADQFIKAGFYNGNKVIFKVGADGQARVGVKKEKGASNDWTFVDNFKLTYYGTNSALVPTAIETVQVVPAAKGIYTITGVRVSGMNKAGLYIVNGKKVLVK